MHQAAFADQVLLRYLRKRRQDPSLDRRLGLRARCHRQEAAETHRLTPRNPTDLESDHVRTTAAGPTTYENHA